MENADIAVLNSLKSSVKYEVEREIEENESYNFQDRSNYRYLRYNLPLSQRRYEDQAKLHQFIHGIKI